MPRERLSSGSESAMINLRRTPYADPPTAFPLACRALHPLARVVPRWIFFVAVVRAVLAVNLVAIGPFHLVAALLADRLTRVAVVYEFLLCRDVLMHCRLPPWRLRSAGKWLQASRYACAGHQSYCATS